MRRRTPAFSKILDTIRRRTENAASVSLPSQFWTRSELNPLKDKTRSHCRATLQLTAKTSENFSPVEKINGISDRTVKRVVEECSEIKQKVAQKKRREHRLLYRLEVVEKS